MSENRLNIRRSTKYYSYSLALWLSLQSCDWFTTCAINLYWLILSDPKCIYAIFGLTGYYENCVPKTLPLYFVARIEIDFSICTDTLTRAKPSNLQAERNCNALHLEPSPRQHNCQNVIRGKHHIPGPGLEQFGMAADQPSRFPVFQGG